MGCTTDAHPLYPTFMGCLSACIFEWDAGDLCLLRQAKRKQLMQEGVPALTDILVDRSITKKELSLYCRRRTEVRRPPYASLRGCCRSWGGQMGGTLWVCLCWMRCAWSTSGVAQKRHVRCIQDVPGVPLYTEVGTTTKAGVTLTRYRCARGSTSLESFHCHLNRFIPGWCLTCMMF